MAPLGTNPNPFNSVIGQSPIMTSPSPVPIQQQCNIIWVDGMEDVLNHAASPNTQLYFAERNAPVLWIRETDANGKVKNPLHRLPYTVEEVAFGPEANFVTKTEHQQLYDLVQSMNDKLTKLLE